MGALEALALLAAVLAIGATAWLPPRALRTVAGAWLVAGLLLVLRPLLGLAPAVVDHAGAPAWLADHSSPSARYASARSPSAADGSSVVITSDTTLANNVSRRASAVK